MRHVNSFVPNTWLHRHSFIHLEYFIYKIHFLSRQLYHDSILTLIHFGPGIQFLHTLNTEVLKFHNYLFCGVYFFSASHSNHISKFFCSIDSNFALSRLYDEFCHVLSFFFHAFEHLALN